MQAGNSERGRVHNSLIFSITDIEKFMMLRIVLETRKIMIAHLKLSREFGESATENSAKKTDVKSDSPS